ncbi:VOC family protein [Inquilinus limosus]|uniref:VOC family protein n=1 Tax=Inquilinus limosus TaxID=171674 RepID=UPI0009DF79D7|nr:VOC family protein [Inquilinus limosus]
MLSHITVGVADVSRALQFYGPVFESLGLILKFADDKWAYWKAPGADRPLFIVARPFDGRPATVGNGQMVALLAKTRSLVDQCYAAALAHGGTDEGTPGLRPHYHPNYYGAYFRDLDGNKLCVCCHQPE